MALALAGVAAAVALAWPHSESVAPRPHAAPAAASGLINGHQLQLADCTDWNAGTASERSMVVTGLGRNAGGATGYGPGVTLPAADAVAMFDRACAGPIARHWLLYVLYTRAAGFRSLTPAG